MGRFVRNQFGQDVYVPSVEERGGPASPIPWSPIDPTSLSDLAAPIPGMGVVPDIEREQPVIYDRENLQFDNLMLTEEENEQMRQMERTRRLREQQGLPVSDRPFMQVRPTRPQDTAVGRVVEQNRAQERAAEQQQIRQETDARRRKELEKHQQNRSRKDAMLNSPEAREMVSKIQQGLADEEDFKANWVKDKTHAWDVGIEGDAYQELWAQLNQDSILAKKAGEFIGKTIEDPDRTAVGSEIRDEFYAELEQEHNQRELEKELRRESRPLFHDPLNQFGDESIRKVSEDTYAPKTFDPYSRKTRNEAEANDRLGQVAVSNQVEKQISNLEQLTEDLANAETARSQASTGFGPGAMFGTPELAIEEDLIIKTNQAQREWRKLQDLIHKHLDDPSLSDEAKRNFASLLHKSGKRLVEADVNSRYEIRLKEKVNTLASTDYWKNLEQRKGRKLGQEERMQYLRDTDTPMEMFLEEQTHKQLSKHRKSAALKSIQNSPAFKVLVGPLGSSDTGFQVLLGITDGITGLLRVPVSAGAAAGVPGFTKTGGELSDFLEDHANAVDIYTKNTLGDGRSLKTLGLNPHQFRGVVTSIYQSMVLGGFGLGSGGVATGFGLTSAADEYQRGIDEGLSRGTASLYAGIQGVFEGGIEYALPGTNKWAANLMTRGVLNQSAKNSIKVVAPTIKKRFIDFAKTIGQEQASEALTTITQLFAEGSFIHEDKSFFAKQIGPAFLETVETVFAQTMLMGGGGNLVSGRNRRLKATIAERNRRYQERLDRMYGKLAPLTGQIRTSGSLSDRMAEVINRISPAGAAQLRKLREQGKQISRTAIEKLYGPEIAGRLTKLEQREAFADAILGQKQRVQQEVAANSPVLQESPTKVVEVEDQQTGEKNVVTVNVEQGQTAQEAVDAQVRTATGETPVVTAEPDTESLGIRDPESIMEEIKDLENSIINPETTPAERETFEKRKKVLKQALNKRLRDRKKKTPEAEATTEAPAEAPVEGEQSTVDASLVDDPEGLLTMLIPAEKRSRWKRVAAKIASITRGLIIRPGNRQAGMSVSGDGSLNVEAEFDQAIDLRGGEDVALVPIVSEEVAHHAAAVSNENHSEIYQGLWSRLSKSVQAVVETAYFHSASKSKSFFDHIRDQYAQQRMMDKVTGRGSESSLSRKQAAAHVAGSEIFRMLMQRRMGITITESLKRTDETDAEYEQRQGKLNEALDAVEESLTSEENAAIDAAIGEFSTFMDIPGQAEAAPTQAPTEAAPEVAETPTESPAEGPTEQRPPDGSRESDELRLSEIDAEIENAAAALPPGVAEQIDWLFAEISGSWARLDAVTNFAKNTGVDFEKVKNYHDFLKEKGEVEWRIKNNFFPGETPTYAASEASTEVAPEPTPQPTPESAPETTSEFSAEGKLPADVAKELGDLIKSATTKQDKKSVLDQWNRFDDGAKQSIFASFTESQKQQLYEIEIDAKTIPQLKAQLKEMGVKGYSGKNKAGLIKMILEAQAPTEAPTQAAVKIKIGETKPIVEEKPIGTAIHPEYGKVLIMSRTGQDGSMVEINIPNAEGQPSGNAQTIMADRLSDVKIAEPTPTEAAPQTPAEKQQQKADEAAKKAAASIADLLGGGMAFAKKGEPQSKRMQRAIEDVADYLFEQAKATGLKIAELAKKWYDENSKGKKSGEKETLKKIITEAATNANNRVKQKPPQEKPKKPRKKTTPTPEGEFSDEVYSIKNANVDADLEALNLPKPTPAEELAFQETLDEAVTATTDDADSLVSDLLDNPRAPSPWGKRFAYRSVHEGQEKL